MIRIMSGADATVAALNAERMRLEVISQNIANANVTNTPEGGPDKRKEDGFESVMNEAFKSQNGENQTPMMVKVGKVETDKTPGMKIKDPEHPHADAEGYVTLSNVNIHEEMVDMIMASRAYEANLSAMKYARSMAVQTLRIGRS